jgi:predicted amidohydrolase/peroxiredoxin
MGGTGKVSFPITTTEPRAQEFFLQGVGQLHGFWWLEAERSFRQVAALDPSCPMAYWGMALANLDNEERAQKFIARAVELKDRGTSREREWIEAFSEYFEATTEEDKDRRRQLVRRLESLIEQYPNDLEAKAFLALWIWRNDGQDWPISSHQAVESLIQQVLRAEPLHPIHHYRIHLWDHENASRALTSASLCGQSAPSIAHMWHMPGHIYSKVHRYSDAAYQQEAAARVDHARMIRDQLLPDQIHNYSHNNEWLIRNLSHIGRAHDAIELAKNMIELPRHPRYNQLGESGSSRFGRERLIEVLVRYELWEELIQLAEGPYLEPTDLPQEQARRLWALGLARLAQRQLDSGRAVMDELSQLVDREKAARAEAESKAETKARTESKSDEQITNAREQAGSAYDGRIGQIERWLAELEAVHAATGGDCPTASHALRKLTGVSKDRLAIYYARAGDLEKAVDIAREAAENETGQFQPLASYVDLLQRSGQQDTAAKEFERLRTLAAHADLDVPVMQRLAPLASRFDLPTDWRLSPAAPADVGDRPDLSSLGPFRWKPWPAPDWALTDAAGKSRSLAEYRGRPVVVIAYLGYGCLHCVEQLQKLAPAADRFHAAGIALVGISTDSPADLTRSVADYEGEFAFPLVSNSALDVFKAYRCFDDFEQIPLHGTFLIDDRGLVRWQDINYEPFTDVEFLLAEAKRLLALPDPPSLTPRVTPRTARVAGVVLKWIRGDKDANYRRAEPMIREAAAHGARIVCTTECFLDGYAIADKSIPLDQYRALGEPIPEGEYFRRLSALAKELEIHLVAGLTEADGEDRYNTSVLIGPTGELVGKYRKQKLQHESVRNTAGTDSPVFETPFGRMGIMICADRTEPAIVRRLCTAGAEFLICPSGGMFGPRSNDPIVQARSAENQISIVFVHPAQFLVTAPDGSAPANVVLGEDLLVEPDQVGTEADSGRVFYFDLHVDQRAESAERR